MKRGSTNAVAQAVLFAAALVVLQGLYVSAGGTWVERVVVEELAVRPTARLLDIVVPELLPRAHGPYVVTNAARLGVFPGCEGLDVVILFAIAVAVARRTWWSRLVAVVVGGGILIALNAARLAILLIALSQSPRAFALLHAWVTPVVMVGAAVALYWLWTQHAPGRDHDGA